VRGRDGASQACGDRELARRYDLVRKELAETIHLNETLGARRRAPVVRRDRRRGGTWAAPPAAHQPGAIACDGLDLE